MHCVERLTRPLFRLDPGWLFIAAGLVVCAAGIILPAQNDLHALGRQLEQLEAEEARAYARLKAHSDFMDQVDRADPALIRRLAATQLNLVPEGDTPVLLAASATVPVTHWIDAAVQVDIRPPKTTPNSTLSRLANGPYRLWMFGAGIMCVFVGLMLGPGEARAASFSEDHDSEGGVATLDADESEASSFIEALPPTTQEPANELATEVIEAKPQPGGESPSAELLLISDEPLDSESPAEIEEQPAAATEQAEAVVAPGEPMEQQHGDDAAPPQVLVIDEDAEADASDEDRESSDEERDDEYGLSAAPEPQNRLRPPSSE